MTFFLFAVCIVLGLLVILQKRQYVRLSRELQYMDERLRQIADADGAFSHSGALGSSCNPGAFGGPQPGAGTLGEGQGRL